VAEAGTGHNSETEAPTTFEEFVKDEVAKLDPNVDRDILKMLYEGRLQQFIADNNRIWTTGALLVPLALAAFFALASIDHPQLEHFIVLGAASSLLGFFWLSIAEGHRGFQDLSHAWMTAIEARFGVRRNAPKGTLIERQRRERRVRIQIVRYFIVAAIPILWIIAALWWPR
jgi:hypothetical protein